VNLTDRAIELIRRRGTMRSPELSKALGHSGISALLRPKVEDGTLVACTVRRPEGGMPVNEYRLSVAGGGKLTDFNDISRANAARQAARPAAPAPAAKAPPHDPVNPRIGAIEKDIAIPARSNRGEIRKALEAMAVGDSRVLSYSKQAIRYAAGKAGIEVLMRSGDVEGDLRVWRMK
jgi:hypothetical protein